MFLSELLGEQEQFTVVSEAKCGSICVNSSSKKQTRYPGKNRAHEDWKQHCEADTHVKTALFKKGKRDYGDQLN